MREYPLEWAMVAPSDGDDSLIALIYPSSPGMPATSAYVDERADAVQIRLVAETDKSGGKMSKRWRIAEVRLSDALRGRAVIGASDVERDALQVRGGVRHPERHPVAVRDWREED